MRTDSNVHENRFFKFKFLRTFILKYLEISKIYSNLKVFFKRQDNYHKYENNLLIIGDSWIQTLNES